MAKIKVFVSSALDELEYEREVASRVVRDLDLEPATFEGFPAMDKALEDAYLDEVKNADIFVLILWKTLRQPVKLEYDSAREQNKPILIFVKMLKEGEQRDDSLNGFLGSIKKEGDALNAGQVRFYKHYRSLNDLETEMRKGIGEEITHRLRRAPVITHTREEMYKLGTDIIHSAKKRLAITQQTPSLFLGARPYRASDSEKVHYEIKFRQALEKWVETAIKDEGRELIYLYDPHGTKLEIEKEHLQLETKEQIHIWKEKERRSRHRVRLSSSHSRHSGPLTVGDNWFAIWVMGDENAVAISYVNEQVSDALYRIFSEMGGRVTTAEDLTNELGLD